MTTGGILQVQILNGTMYRNTDIFGEMDPYVVIQVNGKKKYRTSPCESGGKQPIWNLTFEIPLESPTTDELNISCHDRDLIYDDFIGSRSYSADYFTNKNFEPVTECLQLFTKAGKKAADIWI